MMSVKTEKANLVSVHRTLRCGTVLIDATLSDFSFPRHSHEYFVLGFLTDGQQKSHYGLRQIEAQKGDVLLVNPGETHDGVPSGWRGRQYRMLNIECNVFDRIAADAIGLDKPSELGQTMLRNGPVLRALSSWFDALAGKAYDKEQEAAVIAIGTLSDTGILRSIRAVHENDLAVMAKRRLDEYWQQDNMIGELSRNIGASRYQIIRAFKNRYGLTPESYRRQKRVECARKYLSKTVPLAEIAVAAGFADQSHLCREFRRLIGVTPGTYRLACN